MVSIVPAGALRYRGGPHPHYVFLRKKGSFLSELSSDFNFCARASSESSEEFYGLRRGKGGVAILWRKCLTGVSSIENIKHDRICGIRVQTAEGTIMAVLSVYLPASGSNTSLQSF